MMTQQIQTSLILLFLIPLFAIIGLPAHGVEEPVELRYRLKAGNVLTYKTQMEMTVRVSTTMGVQEGYTESETDTSLTVIQINDEGIITGATITNVQIKKSLMDGKDMTESMNAFVQESGMQYQFKILRLRPDGRDLSFLPEDAENNLIGWIALPEKPVKIGDSWTQSLAEQMLIILEPELDFILTSTLAGFERVGKYNTAKIELTAHEQESDMPEQSNDDKLAIFFALDEGFPVKVKGTIKIKSELGLELETHLNAELTEFSNLSPVALNQARAELTIIKDTLEDMDLLSQSFEGTKTALEKFISDYPQSQWRRGVEGLINRFSAKGEYLPTIEGQSEDSSTDIDKYLSSLGISKANGQKASDFTLETTAGKKVSLSDYKGKIVFLNFWATWCPPCRREMPSMEKLYQKFKDRDFIMLAVDLQENPATVAKFMQDNKFSFPALIDKGEVSIKYRVSSIPTTFFIDKYGGIIGSAMGDRDWASEEAFGLIEALLKSKSSKEK